MSKICCDGNCNQGRDCPLHKPMFSGEDFDAADHIGEIRKRPVLIHTLARPLASVAKCDHDWPEDTHGTDMDGSCTKCGMSFMLYIHVECP